MGYYDNIRVHPNLKNIGDIISLRGTWIKYITSIHVFSRKHGCAIQCRVSIPPTLIGIDSKQRKKPLTYVRVR